MPCVTRTSSVSDSVASSRTTAAAPSTCSAAKCSQRASPSRVRSCASRPIRRGACSGRSSTSRRSPASSSVTSSTATRTRCAQRPSAAHGKRPPRDARFGRSLRAQLDREVDQARFQLVHHFAGSSIAPGPPRITTSARDLTASDGLGSIGARGVRSPLPRRCGPCGGGSKGFGAGLRRGRAFCTPVEAAVKRLAGLGAHALAFAGRPSDSPSPGVARRPSLTTSRGRSSPTPSRTRRPPRTAARSSEPPAPAWASGPAPGHRRRRRRELRRQLEHRVVTAGHRLHDGHCRYQIAVLELDD